MTSQSLYKNSSIPLENQQPQVLQDAHELLGTLESVESAGGGLVRVRIAGLERLVSDELEGQLKGMVGKKASILRVENEWSVVEGYSSVKD